ncbi:uncharacterized protein LOC133201765 isoform X2 [Saccostrea echinata]|uniref:uncharacterized protein LOC133201765 isoform X2 n=1 Tax=Saccostrea echinata TaxID=191078 RepID=UPI002A822B7C|nr:uncharacterized protein LOC133201765 isoform X2 [Saccostrea echinata]
MFLLKTLLCISFATGILSQTCDITSANKCWSPLTATMGDLVPSSTPKHISPSFKVNNVCSGLHKVFSCSEKKMSACNPEDRLLYDTAKSSSTFLCTQGKQGYIEHAHCLFSDASHKSMKKCTSEAVTLIQNFILPMSDLSELKGISKELCGFASAVRSCLLLTAKENCGEPAALYLQQYIDATIKPMSDFLSCSSPKSVQDVTYFPSSDKLRGKTVTQTTMIPTLQSTPNIPSSFISPSGPNADILNAIQPEEIVQSIQTNVPKCDRYCFVFKHDLSPSLKPGYDDWCEINCRQGFCPQRTCTCNCNPVRRKIVCEAMDLRFKMQSRGSEWCNAVCKQGFCPRNYCKCRVELESQYVPSPL